MLPYHTLGESKYEMLGKAYTMGYEIKSSHGTRRRFSGRWF